MTVSPDLLAFAASGGLALAAFGVELIREQHTFLTCDPRPLGMGVQPAGDGMAVERLRIAASHGTDAGSPNLADRTPVRSVKSTTCTSSHVVASRHLDAGLDFTVLVGVRGEGAVNKNGPAAGDTAPGLDQQAREANR